MDPIISSIELKLFKTGNFKTAVNGYFASLKYSSSETGSSQLTVPFSLLRLDRQMGELAVGRGAMPMLYPRQDIYDVSNMDSADRRSFFLIVPFTFCHDQDLIAGMDMPIIPGIWLEYDIALSCSWSFRRGTIRLFIQTLPCEIGRGRGVVTFAGGRFFCV